VRPGDRDDSPHHGRQRVLPAAGLSLSSPSIG
jgi:hypothetical protein